VISLVAIGLLGLAAVAFAVVKHDEDGEL